MTSRVSPFAATLVALGVGCGGDKGIEQVERIRSVLVGTPASILEEATRGEDRSSMASGFTFKSDTEAPLPVIAEAYDFSSGYLAATGSVPGFQRASFLLKGDAEAIYGWIVVPEKDLAYEYTTERGRVFVTRVPVRKIFPVCNDLPAEPDPGMDLEVLDAAEPGGPPHVGAYDNSDTNKLQSKPGAAKVLYMDISAITFAAAERWKAWQGVAAAYSAFDVNVTTDSAVYDATAARDRGKACVSNEDGRSTCAVNAFGTSRCCTVFNKGNGNYQGLTTAHELGHLVGLDHDGTSSEEYFAGLSSFRWVPMMGDMTPKSSWGAAALFQWNKGDYSGANNKEDDLAIISRNLPFRADDIPDSKALTLRNGSEVSAVDNRGQIATNTDSDAFTFTVGSGGGQAKLLVDRIEVMGGGMLDVDAEIQNGSGTMVAQSNAMAARTATFDVALPAGDYRLIIKGGAEGTPQNGFSNYGSLGFYGISGTITGAIGGGAGGTGGEAGSGGAAGTGGAAGGSGGRGTGGRTGSGGAGSGGGGRVGSGGGGMATGGGGGGGTGIGGGGTGISGGGTGGRAETGGSVGTGGSATGGTGTVVGTGGAPGGPGGLSGGAGATGSPDASAERPGVGLRGDSVTGGCACTTASESRPSLAFTTLILGFALFARHSRTRRLSSRRTSRR